MPYYYDPDMSNKKGHKPNKPSLRELLVNDIKTLIIEFKKLVKQPADIIENPTDEEKNNSIKLPMPPLLKDIKEIKAIIEDDKKTAFEIHRNLTDLAKDLQHRQWYWFMPFVKDLKVELLKILDKSGYRLINLLADDNQTIHQDNDALKKENAALKLLINDLKNDEKYQELEKKLQNLSNVNTNLRQQAEKSEQALKDADKQIEEMSVEMDDLQNANDDLQDKNIKLIEENKQLKARVAELEEQLKNNNTGPRKSSGYHK